MGKANTSSGDSKSGQKSGQERPQQPQAAGNANNSDTAKTAEAQSAPQSGNDGETGEPFAEEHFETASAVADDARQDYTAESDDGAQPDLSLDEALARLAEAEAGRREAEDKLLRIQAEMQNPAPPHRTGCAAGAQIRPGEVLQRIAAGDGQPGTRPGRGKRS